MSTKINEIIHHENELRIVINIIIFMHDHDNYHHHVRGSVLIQFQMAYNWSCTVEENTGNAKQHFIKRQEGIVLEKKV